MRKLEIKLENGFWLVNDKKFNELSFEEKNILSSFIKSFEQHKE